MKALIWFCLGVIFILTADSFAQTVPARTDPAAELITLKNKLAVTENIAQENMNARRDWEISARQLDAVVTDLKAQLEKAKAQCSAASPPQ
jgi:hypothetical protein